MGWRDLRVKESSGFVSIRIIPYILLCHELLYGNSFYIDYGKFKQVLFPWEVGMTLDNFVFPE